ncbi:glycosyltransferase family 9 protein [Luteolibacter pohnpeiensis]|uniref:Glycosyltransferase family 9 protein n=1 Tax=Luteolibacter pohnpeiensis TaxID=454153 RepID=A0A934VTW8_9BACT|nr:glycosyltransferase family 9 protein [Luteolibacter pohnpeiensis]MBK1881917.1 glycosyltransferase family 9 protein [Luteolibacter pohnpeiensis]
MSNVASGEMLIAAPARWEEACFSIPAIRAISASGLKVGVLCPEAQRGLWDTVPEFAIVGYAPKSKPRGIAAQIAGNWQASIAWAPGIEAEAFEKAKILRRIGPDVAALKKLLTHSVAIEAPSGAPPHRVQFYLGIAEKLGVVTAKPEYFASVQLAVTTDERAVMLSPDSDFGANYEWPLERWIEVAKELVSNELKITVAGIPGGRNVGKALAAAMEKPLTFVEVYPLPAHLELFAAQSAVIAADSSLPHLAAHAGATCLTLFGPNDPNWKRPLGRQHQVIRRHVECAPCLLEKCPLDLRCQKDLSVEKVLSILFEK